MSHQAPFLTDLDLATVVSLGKELQLVQDFTSETMCSSDPTSPLQMIDGPEQTRKDSIRKGYEADLSRYEYQTAPVLGPMPFSFLGWF